MKKLILLAFMAVLAQLAVAQTVSYEYDNAGNRVKRKTIVIPQGAAMMKSAQLEPVVDSWGEREVIVYPNPTKGNLKVSITGGDPDDKYTYVIYNSSGKPVLNGRINRLGEYPFKLQRYSAGMYILVLQCNNDKKTFKIIKE